jgi:anti-sigma regulatory factor (Ser/Thr protein kinase)
MAHKARNGKEPKKPINPIICNSCGLITNGTFKFRTLDDVSVISSLVSTSCYNPEDAYIGIYELMVNAIEHGNLGINFEEKTQLLLANEWANEINKRLENKEYKDKEAHLFFEKKNGIIEITIEDMGDGFDYTQFIDVKAKRSSLPNGRGITIAKLTSFTSMEYVGKGNKVICRILANPCTS